MTFHVTISPNGRLCLPAELRRRLGLADGGALVIEETKDGLMMRTVSQSVSHARALARQFTGSKAEASVASFLANRRSDSGE